MIKSDSVDKNLKIIEKGIILAIKEKVNFSPRQIFCLILRDLSGQFK